MEDINKIRYRFAEQLSKLDPVERKAHFKQFILDMMDYFEQQKEEEFWIRIYDLMD